MAGTIQKIDEIDKNLRADKAEEPDALRFYDVKQAPFRIYGLCDPRAEGDFHRMPPEIGKQVSEGVASLNFHTSGGRVRFSSDSMRLAIRAQMPSVCRFPHMPLTGTSGFTLYEIVDGKERYIKTFIPPVDMTDGYTGEMRFWQKKERMFTLYMPLYNTLSSLEIGLEPGASLKEGPAYSRALPVVYYGSSITQGGCVSHPGNAYPAIISRKYDLDFINLGFSGGAKGETAMAEYLAGLRMEAFVCDYDHNAPSSAHLEQTLGPLVAAVRRAWPQLPVLLVSRPDFYPGTEDERRREAVFQVYKEALDHGDRHIVWVDGRSLFEGEDRDACTVDGTHPNDLGMARMAWAIGRALESALPER